MMKKPANILVALAVMQWSGIVFAHPGGLNAEGCHNNRKTGDYHCHGRSEPQRVRSTPSQGRGGAYYSSCAAARADGAAPLRRGDPGYGKHLDRDDDGIACE